MKLYMCHETTTGVQFWIETKKAISLSGEVNGYEVDSRDRVLIFLTEGARITITAKDANGKLKAQADFIASVTEHTIPAFGFKGYKIALKAQNNKGFELSPSGTLQVA